MNSTKVKTLINCVVTPRDPINYNINWDGDKKGWAIPEDNYIELHFDPNSNREKIIKKTLKEAVRYRSDLQNKKEFLQNLFEDFNLNA